VTEEYRALTEKVASFSQGVSERYRADMACGPGCSSCCHAWLSVCGVERAQQTAAIAALPSERRDAIAERGREQLAREQSGEMDPRCALLEPDGRCAVYEARPLVCRTQGLALRYPQGFIPAASVRTRLANGEVTHCPLNFGERAPAAADVLDAERVDQLLGLVNLRFARASGEEPERRYAISEIAAGLADRVL
jgi:Fe-S-cluster containining protein